MRELSKLEQKIVGQICTGTRLIGGILDEYLDDLVIVVDRDENKLDLRIKVPPNADRDKYIREKANFVTETIVIIINLLDYFREQGYLLTYYPAHGRTVKGYFVNEKNKDDYKNNPEAYTGWWFTDKEVQALFFQYLDIIFIASETLKQLHKDNYVTREQRRHRQSMRVAWSAIAVMLLIGLLGIFDNYADKDNTIKLDPFQFQSIKETVDNISTQLDTLNNSVNHQQTINDTTDKTMK